MYIPILTSEQTQTTQFVQFLIASFEAKLVEDINRSEREYVQLRITHLNEWLQNIQKIPDGEGSLAVLGDKDNLVLFITKKR